MSHIGFFTVKFYVNIDDALDITAFHGIGGIIGLLANGFFATTTVISLDGVTTSGVGGAVDKNWRQLGIQSAYICVAVGYTFIVTALIAKGIDMLPSLNLRASEESESLGMDDTEVCCHQYLWTIFLILWIDRRVCE